MFKRKRERYVDMLILGVGGVSGAGTAFAACMATNLKSVVGIEQYAEPGLVNSHWANNSQTVHTGDDPHYTEEKAEETHAASLPLFQYAKTKNNPLLAQTIRKMTIAVGTEECAVLREQSKWMAKKFGIRLIERDEIARLEPNVIKERDEKEEICAIVTDDGLMVNFQELARMLLADAKAARPDLELQFNTSAGKATYDAARGCYRVATKHEIFYAKSLVVTCGAGSLSYAHHLGLGREYVIGPVKGDYCAIPDVVTGKVYEAQTKGIPFSGGHVDPNIVGGRCRFGPLTKFSLFLEWFKWKTVPGLMRMWMRHPIRGPLALYKIFQEDKMRAYAKEQFLFGLPVVGMEHVAEKLRKIIPSIRTEDIVRLSNAGGTRPQLVNILLGILEMGNKVFAAFCARIVSTPSPGASVSMATGRDVVSQIIGEMGFPYYFDHHAFESAVSGSMIKPRAPWEHSFGTL